MAHPGCKRSRMAIQACYYHLDIRKKVDRFHCDHCQHVKIPCKGLGLLTKHHLTNTPLCMVAVDLICPWTAKIEHFICGFYALTSIDTTTKVVKLVLFDTKSSYAIARKFE